jgi:tRNA (mo5U34)-methyltransferase
MLCYQSLFGLLDEYGCRLWAERLPAQLDAALADQNHGDLPGWERIVENLPTYRFGSRYVSQQVKIGHAADISLAERLFLEAELRKLHPWRKGPYSLFGVEIDSEWRSDWKWDRLKNEISPLKNRLVLDVGCGNGYHCWRMLGEGARLALGIDPTLLSVMQFQAVKKLFGDAPVFVLPLPIESVPADLRFFDTVFSMGVLYHRRSPIDHLLELSAVWRGACTGNPGDRRRNRSGDHARAALCANAKCLVLTQLRSFAFMAEAEWFPKYTIGECRQNQF